MSTFALAPSSVLLLPGAKDTSKSALSPMNVLLFPVPVKLPPASRPKTEFPLPVVVAPALSPKNELFVPVVVETPVIGPTKTLPTPVALGPEETPANRLSLFVRCSTRMPPKLNCVVALRMFAPNAPPTFNAPGICTVSAGRWIPRYSPAGLPMTIVSLVPTTANAPMAVAFVRLFAPTFANEPMTVLSLPVVLLLPTNN